MLSLTSGDYGYITTAHPLDPNHLTFLPDFAIIHGGAHAEYQAKISWEDKDWAQQWLWSYKHDRRTRKVYFRRSGGNSLSNRGDGTYTIYLHVEIMKRTGIPPPSLFHCLVDHINGDSLDYRRDNLRWATHSMNSRNVPSRRSQSILRFSG